MKRKPHHGPQGFEKVIDTANLAFELFPPLRDASLSLDGINFSFSRKRMQIFAHANRNQPPLAEGWPPPTLVELGRGGFARRNSPAEVTTSGSRGSGKRVDTVAIRLGSEKS